MENKWISVEDKLPLENEEVLLFYAGDIVQGYLNKQKYVGSRIVRGCMNDGYVHDPVICNQGGTFDFVTHWMPLPEPPKN